MIRKLNIIIIAFIFVLLMALPSYARSAFFFNFGAAFPLGVYPYYLYPPYPYYPPYSYYGPPPPPPVTESYGDLEIQITPEDINVKVYVDGRFIGQSRDFNGDKIISVPPGKHVIGFRYRGSSSTTSVYVNSGSRSVVSEDFEPNPE
jgi:hypothetical protein